MDEVSWNIFWNLTSRTFSKVWVMSRELCVAEICKTRFLSKPRVENYCAITRGNEHASRIFQVSFRKLKKRRLIDGLRPKFIWVTWVYELRVYGSFKCKANCSVHWNRETFFEHRSAVVVVKYKGTCMWEHCFSCQIHCITPIFKWTAQQIGTDQQLVVSQNAVPDAESLFLQ